jgi:hypothetical protein
LATGEGYPMDAYMMASVGPDLCISIGGFQTELEVINNEARGQNCRCGGCKTELGPGNWEYIAAPGFAGLRYDPTNGTISYGDVYRFGGGAKR